MYTIAFVPNDVDVVMPTWAADLPRLGAIDNASANGPVTGSSLPSDGSVAVTPSTDLATSGTTDTTGVAGTTPTESTDVPSTTAG